MKWLAWLLIIFALVPITAVLAFRIFFAPFYVYTTVFQSDIPSGSGIVVNKWNSDPAAGEYVVFKAPDDKDFIFGKVLEAKGEEYRLLIGKEVGSDEAVERTVSNAHITGTYSQTVTAWWRALVGFFAL